jgi:hypothetical protein
VQRSVGWVVSHLQINNKTVDSQLKVGILHSRTNLRSHLVHVADYCVLSLLLGVLAPECTNQMTARKDEHPQVRG